jgi:hypothetical protein
MSDLLTVSLTASLNQTLGENAMAQTARRPSTARPQFAEDDPPHARNLPHAQEQTRSAAFHAAALQCFENAKIAMDQDERLYWALRGIELYDEAKAMEKTPARSA